jgi:uncharacterized protein (TIGR00251 family)
MRISVRVKPNARQAAFTKQADGTWLAAVNAPPVDGKANAAVIALIAEHFGVAKSKVKIESGEGSRLKKVSVSGI